jgi:proteasome activator subunit 4
VQPLVDFLIKDFFSMDFNAELSFDVVKKLSLFRAMYEELGCSFIPWANEVMEHCWSEIHSDHEEVRSYIGEIMAFTERIMVNFSYNSTVSSFDQ